LSTEATMSGNDDDEIARFLAQKGATKLPPKPARELGETSPGWRRSAERKAERAQSDKAKQRQQRALRERAGFSDDKTKG
jgi:hypothetical protein